MTLIKIGTRESKLALWQAHTVAQLCAAQNISTEILPIKSEGDIDLVTPLYALGVTGIFTRTLDAALIRGTINCAVHSYKDVPYVLADGLMIAAVLTRGATGDVLVLRDGINYKTDGIKLATSSLRRRAQWLRYYPNTKFCDVRGNIQTRLRKLNDGEFDGIFFAKAALERLELLNTPNIFDIDCMLPAPAQGAIVIVCRKNDTEIYNALRKLNDYDTARCIAIEREFMHTLQGGCSAPIGALVTFNEESGFNFKGILIESNGKNFVEVEILNYRNDGRKESFGQVCANEALAKGAQKIIDTFRK